MPGLHAPPERDTLRANPRRRHRAGEGASNAGGVMLGRRVATVGSAWRPDAAAASRWSELLNNQKFIAFLFLTPALTVLMFVVVYPFFSAIWISFHSKMV